MNIPTLTSVFFFKWDDFTNMTMTEVSQGYNTDI